MPRPRGTVSQVRLYLRGFSLLSVTAVASVPLSPSVGQACTPAGPAHRPRSQRPLALWSPTSRVIRAALAIPGPQLLSLGEEPEPGRSVTC